MHIRGDPVVRNLDACVLGRFVGIVCACVFVCVFPCVCMFDVMFVHSAAAMASSLTPNAPKKLYPNSVLAH